MDIFATAAMWAGFLVLVLGTLVVDVFVLGGRHAHRVSTREALGWTWPGRQSRERRAGNRRT
ncbi:hypothetical protein AU476_16540 [Cupriavidus sp. UYMSc13B]|nr:hypothetical protein AU476_16540 [Cupriavidus sp. UYMSc13B]